MASASASASGRAVVPLASTLRLPSDVHPTRRLHVSVRHRDESPSAGNGKDFRRGENEGYISSRSTGLSNQVTRILSTGAALGAAALLASTTFPVEAAVAAAEGLETGALFERTCAGCHSGGGNILQPSATLFSKDLDLNGLVSVDDIYNITYFGKNRMPGYGEKCAPRGQCTFGPRLSEDDIRALAEFVKVQADQGWPKVQPS